MAASDIATASNGIPCFGSPITLALCPQCMILLSYQRHHLLMLVIVSVFTPTVLGEFGL
ncbi:membrane protein [Candidatus Magnetobacterium bavaricum]|uniref:Membrane protein n=1 Tax=Candidatus Magnetobacterium bavaricum TaxID=29290 RepID=A0A0F3GTQ3_9BACT|nr:membrane protein [Candidatus Magnetobacterium bavaricum]KJU85299.1 membrane protein [Candidatus Magnetobacterium bavaricum]